ncbi:YdeI family protein [uncultured Eudoraea sp.]|uniref:YdeI/OmpD-associated family protein n=1 Tax=uncultured Eudoraea sp. TaxID=1035614 RepID=UPI00260C2093|nr:YdeI/OmpD-associated family protein [uncultured Eudoraea sp.]
MLRKHFNTRKEWRMWLEKNHNKESEIWLIFYKVKVKKKSLKYEDAVEEALCFGWIDSTVKRIDDEKHMQRYTPRKAKSNWAASNKKRVKRLIEEGLMTEIGLKAIKIAKQNGSWNKLDNIETQLKIPGELKEAFKTNKKAKELYEKLAPSRKKQIIWWIESAKRDVTKANRVKETISQLLNKTDK